MPDYHIHHITRYSYTSTVIDCTNQLMLYPIHDQWQNVREHELRITGTPVVEVFLDYFGNKIGVFSLIKPHQELVIESTIHVTTSPVEIPADNLPPADQWLELKRTDETYPNMDFLQKEHFSLEKELAEIMSGIVDREKTPFANAQALSGYIFENFEYKKGVTSVETKVDDILKLRAGVCQDFAHVLLVMLRTIDIPARYVSGYICPKNHELRGEGATHAWVEAFIPFYGWLGLDPTNNCIVSDRHVRLAVGRNFSDCTPVKGTYKGSSEHTLEVSVSIGNGKKTAIALPEAQPVFSYTSKNPGDSSNSYRRFLEMQQQQQ